ncbi:MAG: transketolase [Spirochaetales bacterium]|nr:transketolase [Spirochaetales bacterium]
MLKLDYDLETVKAKAQWIRCLIIEAVHAARSGHPGGPLGLADIFAHLFFGVLRHQPARPDWADRDRLLISNGHVCAVRYAAMALSGYFPREELKSFRRLGSFLQGHPSTKFLPAVENSSGSLGQGLSQATGLSLGLRMQKNPARVFCVMSDGECGEGMTWEAAQAAVHYQAPVIGILDYNGIQIDGFVKDVLNLGDLSAKFRAMGMRTLEADGHDHSAIHAAFQDALAFTSGPQMILFRTVLGKGVSFMENDPAWHGKPPSDSEAAQALQELGLANLPALSVA